MHIAHDYDDEDEKMQDDGQVDEEYDQMAVPDAVINRRADIEKQKKNTRMLEAFENVKTHGGPVTAKSIDLLSELSDKDILEEVRFLRMTVAPNIREKRKIDKKFVKFSRQELISQIVNVLKPEDDLSKDIDELLLSSTDDTTEKSDDENPSEGSATVGSVAVFEGPLGQRKVGVVVTETSIQLYSQCRYGFQCDDLAVDRDMWKFILPIEDFDFITRRTGVYMRCAVKKLDII